MKSKVKSNEGRRSLNKSHAGPAGRGASQPKQLWVGGESARRRRPSAGTNCSACVLSSRRHEASLRMRRQLPATAQAMRAAAQRKEARRNAIGAGIAIGFVSSVFFYCMNAVSQEDAITDRELAEFRANRERQRTLDALEAKR